MSEPEREIILASASHSRRKLLEAAGIGFRCVAAGVDEAAVKLRYDPLDAGFGDLAVQLAAAKALVVAKRFPDALVIGADQILVLEGETFDKPESVETARRQLSRLRGKTHSLETAVVCARGHDVLWSHVETPQLAMREFSSEYLEIYVAAEGRSMMESVGGYKIEGLGVQLFENLCGDFFTILGLPLMPLLAFLRSQKAIST